MIVAVKLVMSAATLCFIIGYGMRQRNNPLHRKLMGLGFLLTLAIAVVLVIGVNVYGATYGPAYWLANVAGGMAGAKGVLIAHRIVATAALLVLIAQVVTGLRRHPLHKRLYRATIPLWLVTYVSGMFIFV